ncbi:phage terminase large subunit [Paenibacillus alba]|uniref:Phage terminase large subunit n=1 Tax=Paenibacillus alba TaxID=1197127 RepID=A0ABU6GES5_9BACL|nr:phage terminase large subunit [Paenibacillus alba]MEC0231174.1 phage terminase large subunit [Paenibacillus alba]
MSLTAAEEMELIALLEEEEKHQARTNYYAYVQYTHKLIYTYTRHGEFIANVLDTAIKKRKRMMAGEIPVETQYFMFSVPAQHGKSMHITETFPSYFLGHFPHEGVIEVSYNSDFASKFGGRNKEKVKEFGKELFNIGVAKDKDSSDEWDVVDINGRKTRGGMISRGILSGITGSSLGDCVIIDDPIKNREEANSQTIREKHWDEWKDSIRRRIHPGGIVIVIMTRWHEDDIWGRMLDPAYAKPFDWQVHNLPLECDETHISKEGNPLNRVLGEPLWPERYGYEHVAEAKSYPSSFNAMDQGRPTSQEGNTLKRDWWKYYDVLPPISSKLISIDATFKDEDDSDYVVVQVWGKNRADMFLIDQVRAKMNFPATVQTIRNVVKKHPDAAWKLIEDKANGSAIISTLHREIGGIIPVNPEGGKVARVNAVSAYIESGNVYLPRQAEWIHDFVEEAASFPKGKHDDQVDAMSQALHRFIYFSGDFPEKEATPLPFAFRSDEPSEGGFMNW